MRRFLCVGMVAVAVCPAEGALAQSPAGNSPAADRTRTKLLKVKVSVDFRGHTLRDVLKEIAGQIEMQAERPVLWTYAPGFPAAEKVTYAASMKPADEVLDEVFKLKPGLGYYVVSDGDGPRDGWVRVTTTGERGFAKAQPNIVAPKEPPTAAGSPDEDAAGTRLRLAKELLDGGKGAQAKPVLTLITLKYPKTKAAAEAKDLLEKLPK